ncbi:DHH family phosphoesterase [Clostridium sp. AM58-1XD]|uniref:DHH family phosphoesterase n=1 Tax=Clostridium sp. AM58-1XD TaxID=2292307 RepID=UPI00267F67BF
MGFLENKLQGVKTAVILGHIHPDGDCVGSCLGLYNYIKDQYPDVNITIYLEPPAEKFQYMRYFNAIQTEMPENPAQTDLCICLDSGDRERLGTFLPFWREQRTA